MPDAGTLCAIEAAQAGIVRDARNDIPIMNAQAIGSFNLDMIKSPADVTTLCEHFAPDSFMTFRAAIFGFPVVG